MIVASVVGALERESKFPVVAVGLRRVSTSYVPARSADDWKCLLAEPELHWKVGLNQAGAEPASKPMPGEFVVDLTENTLATLAQDRLPGTATVGVLEVGLCKIVDLAESWRSRIGSRAGHGLHRAPA